MIALVALLAVSMFVAATVLAFASMIRTTGALRAAQHDANQALRVLGRAEQALVDLATSPLLDDNARTLASAALNDLRGAMHPDRNKEINP